MPYKKRTHARFPPARIKKIMQTNEEVGKVSSSVPVMVCILFKAEENSYLFLGMLTLKNFRIA
jgi:hypothetical protein